MYYLLEVLWFLLPAGGANLIPPVAARIWPTWNAPVDRGRIFYGKPLFGRTKTIRGFVVGILFSTIILYLQCIVHSKFYVFNDLEFREIFCNEWWLGPCFGFSALLGDLVKSFFKRRLNFQSGQSWFPWDQIDWVIGVLLVTYPLFKFSLGFILLALVLGILLSGGAKIIGYWLGINSNWI